MERRPRIQAIDQKPIFLPDVQNNPKPGRYLDLIRAHQNEGTETWNIWYLFAFRPEATQHLARFTEEVMRGPSPLTSGLRELIAAFTSYTNECGFCTKAPRRCRRGVTGQRRNGLGRAAGPGNFVAERK